MPLHSFPHFHLPPSPASHPLFLLILSWHFFVLFLYIPITLSSTLSLFGPYFNGLKRISKALERNDRYGRLYGDVAIMTVDK